MASSAAQETANDRFKRGFNNWFWAGLILATGAHALVFAVSPQFGVEDIGVNPDEVLVVTIPDEIEIPPPPTDIARPPTPVIAAVDFDADLTIPLTTFDANPAETLPPPPGDQDRGDLAAAPTFTPMTIQPELVNHREIARVLIENYPPLLRDAGIGGTAHVWFFIDETGHVQRTLIDESSGFLVFDQAALRVADRMRFTPAYNRDRPVPVWVSIAVVFETVER